MKIEKLMKVVINVLLLTLLFSCSKSENTYVNPPSSYEVEYQIDSPNIYITQVTYTNSNGSPLSVTDLSTFTNGKKKISVTNKPFTASIITAINNTSASAINYSLIISVDGVVKKFVNAQAPPMATSTATAEYLIP
jgi:hypothetical protein